MIMLILKIGELVAAETAGPLLRVALVMTIEHAEAHAAHEVREALVKASVIIAHDVVIAALKIAFEVAVVKEPPATMTENNYLSHRCM